MECSAWSYISRKTQKPQKFWKNPQNLGLKCMNAWKKKVLGRLPSDLILVEAENAVGEKILEWERVLGRERKFSIERDVKNENRITPQRYMEKRSSMDLGAIEICRALNLDRSESVKVLSRICRWQKYLDGSRSCRESIDQTESFSMDQEAVGKLSRQILKSSMDWNCANFYQEKKKEGLDRCKSVEDLSSLKKMSFSRKEKHIKMNATSKLLLHGSNQHVKI